MKEMDIPEPKRLPLFSSRALIALIIPIIIERFLDITIGMTDTVMVASVGESAVSAVSLVDNISNLILQIMAALATGGTVIISQYLGREELRNARKASRQLLYTTVVFALALTAIAIPLRAPLLRILFGQVEAAVMEQSVVYFFLTALSYPFIAIFNSCAALFRSMGNSRISMFASLSMNLLNVIGNAIFIFSFGWGVMGAALSTLISRVLASIVMLLLLRNPNNIIYIDRLFPASIDMSMVKNILKIGVPNGMENGMFHFGKIIIQSLVSTFGTAAIAANAVSGRLCELILIPGSAISLAIITVVGQCMGAQDPKQAKYYTKKLMGYAYICTLVSAGIIFFSVLPASRIFNLSPASTTLMSQVVRMYAVVTFFLWPTAFPFANMLRASGDVRFTMLVSILSMMLVRVGLSYLLAYVFNAGLFSVWYAMFADWLVRSACFLLRYRSGKWAAIQVID